MEIKHFFDKSTFTLTYVVYDLQTKDAVIIDPVLDYDSASSTVSTVSMRTLLAFINEHQLKTHYVLETHAHADHISAAHELVTSALPNTRIGIGRRITTVQETFKRLFNLPESFKTDGSQFHELFDDNQIIKAGSLSFRVLFTPGHTPACVSYLFDDAVFTGDALFIPDSGTGRCDFPQGDANMLYHSVQEKLYSLPDETRVFVGHDYQPAGRPVEYETTIQESKKCNIHLKATTTQKEYVALRQARDATLSAPKLLLPSIQVNIAAGEFPNPEPNGQVYLKLPVKRA